MPEEKTIADTSMDTDKASYPQAMYESLDQAWVQIQLSTFTNWINQNLGKVDHQVDDLVTGLSDGITLVRLIEVLQNRKVPGARFKLMNQHQRLDNVEIALKALAEDKVRLVNIGGEDIVNQNVKLMMGLVWSLIKAYHIGKTSRTPPKRLMLTWLQSVLPQAGITNFTSDWNDGRLLLGLLDFFRPGLCPGWMDLDRKEGLNNCQRGLRLAEDIFGVPPVINAEDLNSPNLDELSCLTYMSYLMNVGSPGYTTTMAWVNGQLPKDKPVKDFTESWRDGKALCSLVSSIGGDVKHWPAQQDHASPLENTQHALSAAEELGVPALFSPKDMLHRDLDHLTVMAYCARLRQVKESQDKLAFTNGLQRTQMPSKIDEIEEVISVRQTSTVHSEPPSTSAGELSLITDSPHVDEEVDLHLTLSAPITDKSTISVDVIGPQQSRPPASITWTNHREARLIFTPALHGRHRLSLVGTGITQGRVVKNCPIDIHVEEAPIDYSMEQEQSMMLDTLQSSSGHGSVSPADFWLTSEALLNRPCVALADLSTSPHLLGGGPVTAIVTRIGVQGRSAVQLPVRVDQRDDLGRQRVTFIPDQPGEYKVEGFLASGTPLHQSPLYVDVIGPHPSTLLGSAVDLWMLSPTVQIGQECIFSANLTAVPAHMWVTATVTRQATNGKAVAEVNVIVTSRDRFDRQKIAFLPDQAALYKMEAFVGDSEILGSPFYVSVAAEDPASPVMTSSNGESQDAYCSGECLSSGLAPVNMTTSLGIHGDRMSTDRIRASVIQLSNGQKINALVRDQTRERCSVDFHPKDVGNYEVHLHCDNKELSSSPFIVHVFDPKSIHVKYDKNIITGQETHIIVDSGRAGQVEVRVQPPHDSISDSSKSAIIFPRHKCLDSSNSQHQYTYVAQRPGRYTIQVITVGGLELGGSPKVQTAQWPKAELSALGAGLQRAEIGQPTAFIVDPHGAKGDLFVQVDGPNTIAKCDIEPELHGPPGRYRVNYIPNEPGLYTIGIKWNNEEISGSPFHAKVVAPKQLHCVSDEGLFSGGRLTLYVNQTKELVFDSRGAGPGTLRAEVRGPYQLEIVRTEVSRSGMPDEWLLKFIPIHEGEHRLILWWENFPVSTLPFYGMALPPGANVDHNKVILSGRGLREACVEEEADFVIDGRQAGPGAPLVTLVGTKDSLPVIVAPVSGERYRCSYMPRVPGAYLLTIMWSDLHVRGSPFKVNVLPQSDAGRVICTGDGLVRGIIGHNIQCEIDTKRAGPGELTAHCSGPTKVAYCELNDHRDGTFTLKLNPQESGRHKLQIRYNGKHVQGSPFSPRISGSPDASKVSIYGPGIQSGLLSNFQSRFICETKGAGAGQLTVRIKGRQGAFRVEMERETQKDRTIVCRYDPTESGDYLIHVKWSGVHVRGSPFQVKIFDTPEQLGRYIRANPDKATKIDSGNDWNAEL